MSFRTIAGKNCAIPLFSLGLTTMLNNHFDLVLNMNQVCSQQCGGCKMVLARRKRRGKGLA